MTAAELAKKLESHAAWLRDRSGERANLRGAKLREANLRWADLRWADLREADLREADLREADLRWADLRGAHGYRPLYHTTHGYLVHAIEFEGGWRISAGCRHRLTIDEARAHWGDPGYPDSYDQRMILAALDAFEAWLAEER